METFYIRNILTSLMEKNNLLQHGGSQSCTDDFLKMGPDRPANESFTHDKLDKKILNAHITEDIKRFPKKSITESWFFTSQRTTWKNDIEPSAEDIQLFISDLSEGLKESGAKLAGGYIAGAYAKNKYFSNDMDIYVTFDNIEKLRTRFLNRYYLTRN